jgi:hypothetical protein
MMQKLSQSTILYDLTRLKSVKTAYLRTYKNIPIFDLRKVKHLGFSLICRYYAAHTITAFHPKVEDQIVMCKKLIDDEIAKFQRHDPIREYVGRPLFVLTSPARCGVYQDRLALFN